MDVAAAATASRAGCGARGLRAARVEGSRDTITIMVQEEEILAAALQLTRAQPSRHRRRAPSESRPRWPTGSRCPAGGGGGSPHRRLRSGEIQAIPGLEVFDAIRARRRE